MVDADEAPLRPVDRAAFHRGRNLEEAPTLFDDLGVDFEDPRKATYRAALSLLKHADLGISGVEVVDEAGSAADPRTPRRTIRLHHRDQTAFLLNSAAEKIRAECDGSKDKGVDGKLYMGRRRAAI